jgi:hypothetical protein
MPLEIVVLIVGVTVLSGVMIGPRNGWTPVESALMAGMFSVFGLALLATRKERRPDPPA